MFITFKRFNFTSTTFIKLRINKLVDLVIFHLQLKINGVSLHSAS